MLVLLLGARVRQHRYAHAGARRRRREICENVRFCVRKELSLSLSLLSSLFA